MHQTWVRRECHDTWQRKMFANHALISLPFKGITPLELALRTRNAFMLKVLLDLGGDVEWKNTHGSTTLIEACRYGYLECVQLLVEYGANIYARDIDGKTCLHVALEEQRYYVVTYLLIHDASEGVVRPTDGLCLLQQLIMTDDAALILKLKRKGFNLNVQCPVRSRSLLAFFNGFIGWHWGSFLCSEALQVRSYESTAASWRGPKHPKCGKKR